MGRPSEVAVYSSIALLQERFRHLQRAKEMRREREVLWLLSKAEHINQATPHQAPQSFFGSELILLPRPPLQGSIYTQTSMHAQHHQVIDTLSLSNLQPRDSVVHHASTFNDSDVDTSLHL
ncbi:putative Heavy metal transport/detoxification superfamily protein [Hibiscus syriacus]|uniref:Heavy metal transport/detoxification superfamily protein n=1 Tax=Hibiscus syriacus TaxID=106335 RepID=A0A6A3C8J2_HIBSY|nr:uncharacterized protein LOC120202379 [Hibiscus syriacus]KAE8725453.1 putative Heavy metal transport/detoxification superfamily protein [Hibiscus syriacus]